MDRPRSPRLSSGDWLLAIALCLLLSAGWVTLDWPNLTALRLPDTDDAMRLAQVRDWLGGQAFDDLTQYRLAPPDGVPMHWSRLGDLGPAAIIVAAGPLLGSARAELLAAILWPALLFLALLLLTARIARRAGGDSLVAIVVGALAYPAISLFTPGRIDHHGLQLLLVLAVVEALLRPASVRAGAVAGAASALSLAIGLETAPSIAVAMIVLFALWTLCGGAETHRIAGYGAALGIATAALLLLFRPRQWSAEWCDGFTPGSASAALIAAGVWLGLAASARWAPGWRHRLIAGGAAGVAGLGALAWLAPACLAGPYDPVDPLLAQVWLGNVGEARGLLEQSVGTIIAHLGIALVSIGATIRSIRRDLDRRTGWTILLAFQIASVALAFVQLRAIHVAAALAAPALSRMIADARSKGVWAVAAAWLASAGLVYQQAGAALRPVSAGGRPAAACTDAPTLAGLGRLPAGTLMAPIDLGAFAIGMTNHRAVAAPYHRNGRGNRAMYDFFLGEPDDARAIARLWLVDYVAICPGSFAEVPPALMSETSLARRLQRGEVPGWLSPVLLVDSDARLYRVLPQPATRR